AKWDNGSDITGYDFAFTMKAAFNPYLSNPTWRDNMKHITDLIVDEQNPKKFTVITNNKYILSEEVITTNDIYPEYIYDPEHLLKDIRFEQLLDSIEVNSVLDSVLHRFADQFNGENFSRSIVSGSGPYEFVSWSPNQQLTLKRKENWWGRPFADKHPCLQAEPASIIYYFIEEAQTAITALKDYRIDVVAEITPEQYTGLKAFDDPKHPIQLEAASVYSYYFIAYNNDNPILRDRRVRNAISRLMDIDNIIEQLFYGLAVRTVGPLSPQHAGYNHNLSPLPFDPAEAKSLLELAGWSDTDDDGILDKEFNGIKKDFNLTILTTPGGLGEDVAIVLKSEAKKIGLEFQILPAKVAKLLKDTKSNNYDLACLASVQSIGAYDPYNLWHSETAGPDGTNLTNFRNIEADSLINEIRITLDREARNKLYLRFQEIIYEEQPALFLVSPKTAFAAKGNLELKSTSLRPGFFENTISLKN
ncbi:MAG: hypothetical protein KDC80_23910, partial [Saprospiraceae bacterium]|nr:hypothetical protein [Saprospiraceae bacterium]